MILHVTPMERAFCLHPSSLFCKGILCECFKQQVGLSPGVRNTDSVVSVTECSAAKDHHYQQSYQY